MQRNALEGRKGKTHMEKEEKRLWPGDVGYKGGEYTGTVVVDGKAKTAHIKKDPNGNIVYMALTDKILGIF